MKLRTHITLIIAPIILVQMVVLIVPSIWLYKEFVQDQITGQIMQSVSQVQLAFSAKLDSIRADSAMLAQNVALNRYLRTDDHQVRSYVMHKTLLKEFASFRRIHPEYIEISYITPGGYEEVALLESDQLNKTTQEQHSPHFKMITNSPTTHKTMAMVDPDTRKWVLVSARKLYQHELTEQTRQAEKKLKGYLVVKVSLDFIYDFINDNHLHNNGFASLYDNQGNVLISNGNAIDISNIDTLLQGIVVNNGNEKVISYQNNDQAYLLGLLELQPDLYYTIGWPESELNQVLVSIAYRSLTSSALLLIVSALLLLWVLNKRLISPILALQSAAKKMGEGSRSWRLRRNISEELQDLALSIKDMGENLLRQQQQMRDVAYLDSLTQLPNRLHFTEGLEALFQKNGQFESGIALLFMDLDGFKHVNDSIGHEAGDKVLIAFAKRLKYTLRTSDIIAYSGSQQPMLDYDIARLGGDEFTVLLHGIDTPDDVIAVAERILHIFSDPIRVEQKTFRVGVSIGIAIADESIKSTSELVKNADIAMYEAKMNGKNTYRFFSSKSAAETLRRVEIREALYDAIDNHQLSVVYQPQICAHSGSLLGCEALIRWKHPQHGWVSPDIFIPIAEETGFITTIGRWVMTTVCTQIRQWHLAGCNVPRVSVNVSNVQFAKEDMYKLTLECLRDNQLDTEHLTIEVTESSIMQGDDAVTQLAKMRQTGIRTSLDDFGTGYSSLSALKGLPIDELKIDRSFIRELEKEDDSKAIVSAIIAMAHKLELEVVAEGVETAAELNFLQHKGANIIQGYYFYKPLTGEELGQLLAGQDNKENCTAADTTRITETTEPDNGPIPICSESK